MNSSLLQLILDYQDRVRAAVVLLYRSGIPMPYSAFSWVYNKVPSDGILEGNVRYIKHGAGCLVIHDSWKIDFDFGSRGEIDGIDAWKLRAFAGVNLERYGIPDDESFFKYFNEAVVAGKLVTEGDSLYYLSGRERIFAQDVDTRLEDDLLPSKNSDEILTLYAHPFLSAHVMRENFEKIDRKWTKAGRLSRNDEINFRVYLSSWLAYLWVTCEGFEKIKVYLLLKNSRPEEFAKILPRCKTVGKLIKRNSDALRVFRNDVFHLRESNKVVRDFLSRDASRLPWAHELHLAFDDLFSDYRMACEFHYFVNGRRGEIDLGRR